MLAVPRSVVLVALLVATRANAQGLTCPATSGSFTFQGSTLQANCASSASQGCTTKLGVQYDATSSVLTLPGGAAGFGFPPNTTVGSHIYSTAAADFDGDTWDDFVAADDTDTIIFLRNQTITCGTSGCTGSPAVAPAAQTIPATWWQTLTNVRASAFRQITDAAGTAIPIKASFGGNNLLTPMIAGDFNGDGWPDFAAITLGASASGQLWPTAARLFLNTQNCHDAMNQPCGFGRLCTGQPTNGVCAGTGVTGSGVAWGETQLSCTTTNKCPSFHATFAAYDLRTGVAVSSLGTSSTTTPTTQKPGDFGPSKTPTQNMYVVDWDGDGDLDLLYAHGAGTCAGSLCTNAGATFFAGIDVWRNDCAQSGLWNPAARSCAPYVPRFTHSTTGACNSTSCNNPDVLIPSTAHNTTTLAPSNNLWFDTANDYTAGFAFADVDRDGDLDLVLGSPGCCSGNPTRRLQIFKGTSGNGTTQLLDTANPFSLSTSSTIYPGFAGGLTRVFVYDFSLDGWPDLVVGSSTFSAAGGRALYWKNTGNPNNLFGTSAAPGWMACATTSATCAGCSSTCNPQPDQVVAGPPTYPSFDTGSLLDYDHDPAHTKDMALMRGTTSSGFALFPNRASAASIAPCGTVASGTLPTGPNELTITGACIKPISTAPASTSITYYLTNESPAIWQAACTQTASGFSPPLSNGQCCVNFANITGRAVQWQAVMDSNTTDGAGACTTGGAQSPTISSLAVNYTYSSAAQHYQAGVIVSDGVAYVGSFSQPGDRGHLYASSAALSTTYYDFAAKLDAQSARSVYTTDSTGTALSRIDFSATAPSATLQGRVGATTQAQAASVISWVLSARFGVRTAPPLTRLGSVVDSTPGIVNAPYRPNWYTFLSPTERADYDAFSMANATRVPLVLFGALDGMIHAVITLPTAIADSHNGHEAWAFVPPYVAAKLTADYVASCPADDCASGRTTVTSYPDGSPTLLDYKKSNGAIATVAIMGDGAGGTSVTALDVTQTVTPGTFTTTGPLPMWSVEPGGAAAGKAWGKVGVARVKLGGSETFVAIAGTGPDSADAGKGKIVAGYALETGALLWQFEMACPLTSDITVFETDDGGEPGAPLVDGFADRAVFADQCGNVYKLNPADLGSVVDGYMGNAGYGTIALGVSNGVPRYALFSTQRTTGAIGGQRPIAGGIGARSDATTDMVLFFGTGGVESFDPSQQNEFYAVYAKNGAIRNKLTGNCVVSSGTTKCEKFYGGVVVTPEQVILTRSYDPVISSSTCDFGATRVQSYGLGNFTSTVFDISEIANQGIAAVTGPLFGDAGALYFATVSGEVKRIGTPRAASAGADSAAGTQNGMGAIELTGGNGPFTLIGWRVVF